MQPSLHKKEVGFVDAEGRKSYIPNIQVQPAVKHMKKSEAINHYGSIQRVADVLGIAHTSVIGWDEELIPERCAARLEKESGGVLFYDHEAYKAHDELRRQQRQAA